MSTKHAIAAARFLENKENEAWHDVERFWESGVLDTVSNVQFGIRFPSGSG